MGAKKIKVVFFSRKPRLLGNFSIESYYKQIRDNLGEEFLPINIEMPFENRGLFKRLANSIYCVFNQGDINHITGDIHYIAAFLRKRKTVLTILDCGMLHQAKGVKHLIMKWFWFTMPINRSRIIIAISTATKNDIIHFTGCNSEKIKVIYVSINSLYRPYQKEFNPKEPRILQIGTAPNKNLIRLIPALEDIRCKLVIVGSIEDKVRKLIKKYNVSVDLIDWRLSNEEVLEEYKKCDILSLVSTIEGFGMPIVEGNAVGRVVVTGNTTSMPEIAGNAAVLINPFDVCEIRDGFKRVIKDENFRNDLIKKGFLNSNRFNVITLAKEYANCYNGILNN